jgi:hypothetical protein
MATARGRNDDGDGLEEVTSGNLIRWDDAKTLDGVLVAKEMVPGFEPGTEQLRITVQLIAPVDSYGPGDTVQAFAPSRLQTLMGQGNVQVGRRVRIIYPGTYTKSKQGRPVKDFQVFVGRADWVETDRPGVRAAATPARRTRR